MSTGVGASVSMAMHPGHQSQASQVWHPPHNACESGQKTAGHSIMMNSHLARAPVY